MTFEIDLQFVNSIYFKDIYCGCASAIMSDSIFYQKMSLAFTSTLIFIIKR
uniref:Uncharacterized protein n=1 Tax=Arundo donax TaxID=35708 RepID=A0A0A9CSV0_ARUDO